MKTILLTGASGFVGRNIHQHGIKPSYQLLCPSRQELNCADTDSVDRFFDQHHIDVVIHAAAKPGHRNASDTQDLFYTNTRMFFNLERHRSNYEKMLVIGSGAIYDQRYYRPLMKEESWMQHIPVDEHGLAKYVCAKTIENTSNIYDLRLFGVFGPYEDYAIRFISNAICKTLFDLPITLRQDRIFDYLWIQDLMPILEWFIEHTPIHHAYNITPDQSTSLSDIAQYVRQCSGKDLPIQIAQPGLGPEYTGDKLRLKTELKHLEFTPIQHAIKQLFQWYESQRVKLDIQRLLVDK